MRLPWCDRIALVWGGSLFLILACAWKGPYLWWGTAHWDTWGGHLLWNTEAPVWVGAWEFGWWLVGIPWAILRMIDLGAGGPMRRRGVIVVRPVVLPPGSDAR